MKLGSQLQMQSWEKVLVAATERGVSAVYLATLKPSCSRNFARVSEAEIAPVRKTVWKVVKEIWSRTRNPPRQELPLDLLATAFNGAFGRITAHSLGKTRTYAQVARALASPAPAAPWLAHCATNPVSVVVPCHRVNSRDGNLAAIGGGSNGNKHY